MNREWKPGDLAMVTGPARLAREWRSGFKPEGNVTVMCHRASDSDGGVDFWRIVGQSVYGFLDREVTDARPLVVVDPEDPKQTEEHWRMAGQSLSSYRAALREFANPTPPKPDEPQGLGAVVEDAKGYLFVRNYDDESTHPWHVIDPAANHTFGWWKWDDIVAVRILSAGVS